MASAAAPAPAATRSSPAHSGRTSQTRSAVASKPRTISDHPNPTKSRTAQHRTHEQASERNQSRQRKRHSSSNAKQFLSLVPRLDGAGVAKAERTRNAKRALEDAIKSSQVQFAEQFAGGPGGGKTHRDVAAERSRQSHACTYWAATIQDAVYDGIDVNLPDALLSSGVQRILELEEQAAAEAEAAKLALEARLAIQRAAVKTPFTRPGSQAALRAAAAQRLPLGEGSIVQLKGLDGMTGITLGCIDVTLSKFDGRKGRVSQDPPPWCIKAMGGKAGQGVAANARQEELGGLVPILLDSRSTDKNRHRGVWLAVPPSNLKVLSSV
jgi:hypothetical protein